MWGQWLPYWGGHVDLGHAHGVVAVGDQSGGSMVAPPLVPGMDDEADDESTKGLTLDLSLLVPPALPLGALEDLQGRLVGILRDLSVTGMLENVMSTRCHGSRDCPQMNDPTPPF